MAFLFLVLLLCAIPNELRHAFHLYPPCPIQCDKTVVSNFIIRKQTITTKTTEYNEAAENAKLMAHHTVGSPIHLCPTHCEHMLKIVYISIHTEHKHKNKRDKFESIFQKQQLKSLRWYDKIK